MGLLITCGSFGQLKSNKSVPQSVGFSGHLHIHGGKRPSAFLPVILPRLMDPGNPYGRNTAVIFHLNSISAARNIHAGRAYFGP